jgi:hypothetical protein
LLASTSEIQKLLTKYPNLRSQLRRIYEASFGPLGAFGWNDGSDRGGRQRDHSRHTGSTLEKGMNRGLSKLAKDLESTGEDSTGLNAFYESVARLLPESLQPRAADQCKQTAQEIPSLTT